jgi:hypothetical protein
LQSAATMVGGLLRAGRIRIQSDCIPNHLNYYAVFKDHISFTKVAAGRIP